MSETHEYVSDMELVRPDLDKRYIFRHNERGDYQLRVFTGNRRSAGLSGWIAWVLRKIAQRLDRRNEYTISVQSSLPLDPQELHKGLEVALSGFAENLAETVALDIAEKDLGEEFSRWKTNAATRPGNRPAS